MKRADFFFTFQNDDHEQEHDALRRQFLNVFLMATEQDNSLSLPKGEEENMFLDRMVMTLPCVMPYPKLLGEAVIPVTWSASAKLAVIFLGFSFVTGLVLCNHHRFFCLGFFC